MKTDSKNLSEREFYIDWLRIFLITSVFLYHLGMIFVTWGWHVKNDVLYDGILQGLMSFLHSWRMPLLFMISGAGTYFALRGIPPAGYLAERSKRLLVPLVTGIFILVPVQVYIEKADSFSSLISFYPHMFEGIYPEGNFSWHHLWFIAYLFTLSLIISPFLNIMRDQKFGGMAEKMSVYLSKPFTLNLVIVPLIISQVILRKYFETETHDLINDWASITGYLIFFLAGLILLPKKNITDAAVRDRKIYLLETAAFTAIMFLSPDVMKNERTAEILSDVSELIISWTCSVAAIGYAKKYMDSDSPFRKIANEAIYPFYLLHQPLLVIIGYYITKTGMADWLKALVILSSALFSFILIYGVLIRPCNISRVLFGMKIHKSTRKEGSHASTFQQSAVAERA
jgi:peptidoglycan/LPS O-acetylase OafA/YrhL